MKKYFKSKVGWWLVIIYILIVIGLFIYSLSICRTGLYCLKYVIYGGLPASMIIDRMFFIIGGGVFAYILNIIIFYNIGYIIERIKINKKS